MSKTRVYEWYKRFQEGSQRFKTDECPGRSSSSTTGKSVEKVEAIIMNSRQITIIMAIREKMLGFLTKQFTVLA